MLKTKLAQAEARAANLPPVVGGPAAPPPPPAGLFAQEPVKDPLAEAKAAKAAKAKKGNPQAAASEKPEETPEKPPVALTPKQKLDRALVEELHTRVKQGRTGMNQVDKRKSMMSGPVQE